MIIGNIKIDSLTPDLIRILLTTKEPGWYEILGHRFYHHPEWDDTGFTVTVPADLVFAKLVQLIAPALPLADEQREVQRFSESSDGSLHRSPDRSEPTKD